MQLIYSKFSNERAEQFGIRTDILMDDGKKVIRKSPAGEASREHVGNLLHWYHALSESFEGTPVRISECRYEDNAAYFEFIKGISLEEKLDNLLESNRLKEFQETITAYFEILLQEECLQEFVSTEAFEKIFGKVHFAEPAKARKVTDIDLVFSNVILGEDGQYTLIDYEWSWDFPIPIKYVIYRCLRYYILTNPKRNVLSLTEYCHKFEISDEDRTIFEQMEEHFQRYVSGDRETLSEIAASIAPKSIAAVSVIEEYYKNQRHFTIYQEFGEAQTETSRITIPINPFGEEVEYTLQLAEGVKRIQIAPMDDACFFNIKSLSLDTVSVAYDTNCRMIQEGCYYSETKNARIMVQNLPEHAQTLSLLINVEPCGAQSVEAIKANLLEPQKKTFSWKDIVRSLLHGRQKDIVFNIDRLEMNYYELVVYGWGIQRKTGTNLNVVAVNQQNKNFAIKQHNYLREDVNAQFGLGADVQAGFQLEIPLISIRDFYVKLCMMGENAKSEILLGREELKKVSYGKWFEQQLPSREQQKAQRSQVFEHMPLISIVIPVYNTPLEFMKSLIDSVQQQTYTKWELCLADASTGEDGKKTTRFIQGYAKKDARIHHIILNKNKGISENTNEAIRVASGDWIMFADHDDLLAVDALYEMTKAINQSKKMEFIYSDEDKINSDGTMLFGPSFKPDFNLDMLSSVNYICHLCCVKKGLLDRVGQLRSEFDGAQDYDFILRCVEQAAEIYHISKVLYHWRCHENSTASNPKSKLYAFEAGRRAIEEHYNRMGIPAEVEHSANYGIYHTIYKWKEQPLVSILIPNKDHSLDLKKCVQSLVKKSSYRNFEIIIIENNSELQETFDYYKILEKEYDNIHVVYYKDEFNYSAINNFGAKHAKGDYLLLLNNDTELIREETIWEMLSCCMRQDVGIVGAKLDYEDNTIQHAGVVLGFGGIAGHAFIGSSRYELGYQGRIVYNQNYSAVTAACMMTKRSIFEQVGGLTEELKVAFNDIDYCMKVRATGKLVVYNAYAELYHYESKSRGMEDTPEKIERFNREIELFKKRWREILELGDPYYNPNLTLDKADFSMK